MKTTQALIFGFLFSILSAVQVSATPSDTPFLRSAEEIRTILIDTRVLERLGGIGNAEIRSIQHEGQLYTIFSGDCALQVEVRYIGLPIPGGPNARELHVGYPNCLPGGVSVGN